MKKEMSFHIPDYGKKPTFASFLPGISGIRGIPIWCYYVNRGQGVVSFGVENKDRAIMQFYPAHTAYQNVKVTGFRTFVKKDGVYAECFANENVPHTMDIFKNSLELCEDNATLGLKTEVSYFTLPEERLGALVRTVTITNTSDKASDVEVLDGMPAVIPVGVMLGYCHDIMQTAKAWMQAERTAEDVAYYRVRASIEDSASVEKVEGGNFSYAVMDDGTVLRTVVDPEAVFLYDTSLVRPVNFEENGLDAVLNYSEVTQNIVPCSFYGCKKTLAPQESITIYEMIGQVDNQEILSAFLKNEKNVAYFEEKKARAHALTDEVGGMMETKTANPVFDEYCRYTFLDNVLRGGLPIKLGDNKVFYVYSRKHGDLERDYNYYAMLPEYYSQGNGNFRDVNQNRRSDDFFAPFVGDFNIKTFYSLLQPDGGNPLGVEKITYRLVEDGKPYDFTPGSLYFRLMADTSLSEEERDAKFNEMISAAEPLTNGDFKEGYWTDHWTYNLDLVESFLQIFPDKEEELLFDNSYTWFRPQAGVNPRKARFVKTDNGIRQYHAVEEGLEAKEGCENALLLCDNKGAGKVIRATLMEKLVMLSLTKFAALDAYGMGIDMEGGKPGWYDALNGLPGLIGSSVNELCELARNLTFTVDMLKKYGKDVSMLFEMAEFYQAVKAIANECKEEMLADGESMNFWNRVSEAKESYRAKVYDGVTGERVTVSATDLADTLADWLVIVNAGLAKGVKMAGDVCPAYFYYEVTEYSEDEEGVMPLHFKQHMLPLFLEGAVRYMKLPIGEANRKSLYDHVKASDLYDRKLSMYKVNASLKDTTFEAGRCCSFTPGWLENESIWLHMEYKYLLELIKGGLYKEYFEDFKNAAVPFLDPAVYGRSTFENSSFIASSANPDTRIHGRGFVARLSGSTAEFLQMWTLMMFGKAPFAMTENGLAVTFAPALPEYLIPEDGVVEAKFIGSTLVTYRFAAKKDYIPGQYSVGKITVTWKDGSVVEFNGCICGKDAEAVRNGVAESIIVEIQ